VKAEALLVKEVGSESNASIESIRFDCFQIQGSYHVILPITPNMKR